MAVRMTRGELRGLLVLAAVLAAALGVVVWLGRAGHGGCPGSVAYELPAALEARVDSAAADSAAPPVSRERKKKPRRGVRGYADRPSPLDR